MKHRYAIAIIIILTFIITILAAGCAVMNDTYTLSSKPVKKTSSESVEASSAAEPNAPAPVKKAPTTYKAAETVKEETPAEQEEKEAAFDDDETKAIEAAKAFVKSMDGYKNQQGRELKVLNTVKTGDNGSWIIYMSFTRNLQYYPDKIEYIKINVKLKNWKMDSYTFE